MKRLLYPLLAIFLLMTGCQQEDNKEDNEPKTETNEQAREVSTIIISKNNGKEQIAEKEVEITEGMKLMDALKKEFDINDKAGYITGIEGIEANEAEKEAWMYQVNGEDATVGAEDYELRAGDEVRFDLHKWE